MRRKDRKEKKRPGYFPGAISRKTQYMNIITFISLKGGTGKTSATLNIGAALSRMGYRVLFVDLDSQNSLADTLSRKSDNGGLWPVLEGKKDIKTAIRECKYGHLLNRGTDPTEPADLYSLRTALKKLSRQYDFVMIDTPPALSRTATAALIAADGLIVPMRAQPYSLQSLARLFATLDELKAVENIRAGVYGVLLNEYRGRQILSKQTTDQFRKLTENNGTALFETGIRENVSVPESQAMRESIFDYDNRAAAAADYRAVTAELLERIHEKGPGKR